MARKAPSESVSRLGIFAIATVVLFFTWAFFRLFPFQMFPIKVCVLNRVTGIPCPACGTTRALAWLAQGRLGPAFLMNPLAVLGVLGGLVFLCAYLYGIFSRKEIELSKRFFRSQATAWSWIVATILALNWLYILMRRFYFGIPY